LFFHTYIYIYIYIGNLSNDSETVGRTQNNYFLKIITLKHNTVHT